MQVVAADLSEFSTTISDDTKDALDVISKEAEQMLVLPVAELIDGSDSSLTLHVDGGEQDQTSHVAKSEFLISEEQTMFQRAVEAFLQEHGGSAMRSIEGYADDEQEEAAWENDDAQQAERGAAPIARLMSTDTPSWRTLRKDFKTYLEEPADVEAYRLWVSESGFDLGGAEETQLVSQLLASDEFVRALHSRFVPTHLSYREFWTRYFFKAHLLRASLQRRAEIIQRAAQAIDLDSSDSEAGFEPILFSEPVPLSHQDDDDDNDNDNDDDNDDDAAASHTHTTDQQLGDLPQAEPAASEATPIDEQSICEEQIDIQQTPVDVDSHDPPPTHPISSSIPPEDPVIEVQPTSSLPSQVSSSVQSPDPLVQNQSDEEWLDWE